MEKTDLSSPGVVFDLDGVLIDSHNQHEVSWFQLAKEIGKPLTKELFKESFGMRNEMCIPHVFQWTAESDHEEIQSLGDRKEELYRGFLATSGLSPLPGVIALLENLAKNEIPISLGSSTSRKNIEVCFNSTGLDRFFGEFYTGAEDVTHGKPHPDVFLKAAAKINRSPDQCIVIEDAHVGVEAGIAAGMKVIAVTTTHPAESFDGCGASIIVDSLEEVSAETVKALIASD